MLTCGLFVFLLTLVSYTYCHPTNESNHSQSAETSTTSSNFVSAKAQWTNKIQAMDKVQIARLEKKILNLLQMDKAPDSSSKNLTRWKRQKYLSNQQKNEENRDLFSDAPDIGKNERTIRIYQLEVFGKRRGQAQRKDANSETCSQEFTFNIKLFPSTDSQNLLESCHLDIDSSCSANVYFEEDLSYLNKSSVFTLRNVNEIAQSDDRDSRTTINQRKSMDISSFLYPFWKPNSDTFNLSIVLTCPNGICQDLEPILKLSLKEVQPAAVEMVDFRRQKKRQTNFDSRPRKQRETWKVNTNGGAPTCDAMWDRGFFRDVPQTLYNDLVGGGCCQRHFVMDFAQIGWDNWVVSPSSIRSSYCLGRCQSYGVDAEFRNGRGGNDDSSLYKEIMNLHSDVRDATPCCSPTKFESVVITVVRDDDQLMTQTLSEIIVNRCDCV